MFSIDGKPIKIGEKLTEDDTILRYMNFSQFKSLFQNGLNLTRADIFWKDDPFEGEFIEAMYRVANDFKITSQSEGSVQPKSMVNSLKEESSKVRKLSYVSCWTLSESENVALWKIYGKDKNAIAIKTSIGTLKQAIMNRLANTDGNKTTLMKWIDKEIVQVKYIDHRTTDEDLKKAIVNIPPFSSQILHYKNIGYKYEEEARMIFTGVETGSEEVARKLGEICATNSSQKDNITINIDIFPKEYVSGIIVSPFADQWFYDLLKHEMTAHKMADLVKWSDLKFAPGKLAFAREHIKMQS